MRTQRKNLIKRVSTLILMIMLLMISSCGNTQEKPSDMKTESSVSQTTVQPPSMDINTAAFMGNLKAIQQHIEAGSDLNKKDDYSSTPLIIAATFDKTDVAISLIEAGADMNIQGNDGSTALHTAAFFCRTKIVEALLKNGVDKTIRSNYGSTALESVSGPFSDVKPIYDQISKDLGPLGLKFNYEYLEATRPVIAEMLQ